MKLLAHLLAIAAIVSAPVAAQEPIVARALNIPKTAMAFDDGTGNAMNISIAHPMPVTVVGGTGGGSSGGASTAAPGAYQAGFSPDIGTCTSPSTTSLCGRMATLTSVMGAPMQQTGGSVSIAGIPTVDVRNIPLPTGAATQATLAQLLAAIGTPLQAGGTINVNTLPLPPGAATAAGVAALGPKLDTLANVGQCGPTTGNVGAANAYVELACPGAGSYNVVVSGNFNGTLQFIDPLVGAGKRVMRGGVASLDVSAVSYNGTAIADPTATTPGRSYNVSGGNALRVVASAYTSGTMKVTIVGSQSSTYPIINGEVQTPALVALLNGRGFTGGFPGGTLNVANSNLACLTIANPSNSGIRGIYESRQMSTDVVTGQQPPRFYVVNNATAGTPTTAATINNRGAGGTSGMTLTYGSLSALPTGGATALGGYVPTGGVTYSPPLEKTIEPGQNQTMCVIGVNATGAVGATSSPSIIFGWREQAIN